MKRNNKRQKLYKNYKYAASNKLKHKFWLMFTYLFIVSLFFSNIFSSIVLKNSLGISNINQNIYRIAIIDTAFDLSKFARHQLNNQIITPMDIENNTPNIQKSPIFDYNNQIKFNNHGTDIMNLFIGPHGLLPNAQIIPIQIKDPMMLPKALEYAINHGAQIINISLSFAQNNVRLNFMQYNALLAASKYIPIFIAAGNDGLPLESHQYGQSMLQLAKESNGRIFLVAATKYNAFDNVFGFFKKYNAKKNYLKKKDMLADFSNYAKLEQNQQYVLYVPGQNVSLNPWHNNFFNQGMSGTSIAAPIAIIKYIYDGNL